MFRSTFIRTIDPEERPLASGQVRIGHDHWVTLVCGALGEVKVIPEALALWRRHGSNASEAVTDGSAQRVRQALALRTEEGSYQEIAGMMRERAGYLASLRPAAQSLGDTASAGLERAVDSHRRHAQAMDRRAVVYGESRRRYRAMLMGRHVLQRDYAVRSRGGLGLASLARDLTLGLCG